MHSLLRLALRSALVTAFTAACFGQGRYPISSAALREPVSRESALRDLAVKVIGTYTDVDRGAFLGNLFRLQIVAGRYGDAGKTLTALHVIHSSEGTAQSRATDVQYEIFVRAKVLQRARSLSFEAAFAKAFRERVSKMDEPASAMLMREFSASAASFAADFETAATRLQDREAIELVEALNLIRRYQISETYRVMGPLVAGLVAADDDRRYRIERDLKIATPDGATVCAMVVRSRHGKARMPSLLNFTIYADAVTSMNEARRTASMGYAGVEGFTRGKACSPDQPVAYEKDGDDARALIQWISVQPWSDDRVGMYGGSYEGFTQWAAAKKMPAALKALMPSVSASPGIDVPMEGNVFQTFVYYWPLYAASDHVLHDDVMNDRARWRKMEHDWYVSGKPYRALESFDGEPNPFFDRWLQHPDYDAYWQNMIPYRDDFARIDIPVLTTTGYYDDGQIGALYYLSEHYKYRPNAEHYLLIGPYDHVRGQRGTVSLLGDHQKVLEGYTLDDAAQIDLGDLRYKWFDYVFRGAARPVILQDRINFETMGSNKWRHAGSLGGMAEGREAFHLSGEKRGEFYRLARSGEALTAAGASLTVNLADRSDADRVSPTSGDLIDKNFDNWNSVTFVSDPFERPAEISGLFSGSLDFVTNKKDFDVEIDLYELDAKGNYLQLAYYKGRASHIKDRSVRQLLVPEEPTRLDFTSGRLMSRRFEPGSRLVVQIGVMKSPFAQVNFGSGKDVSDESVADAGEPLRIDWLPATTIEIPMRDTAR